MKNKQGITIAALIIAIVGLSIGFAAFSNTLNISSSATVNPDDSAMNVVWSSSSSSAQTDTIQPTKNIIDVANFTATNANITGTDYRTLNNVIANFTAPGQTVTYNLHVFNAGSYTAYLTNLVMGNKTCDAIEQQNANDIATDSLVQLACQGISISVTIGTETLTSSGSLNNQALAPNTSVSAQVVITYAEGSSYVDGPMSVTFGDITFTASTVQAQAQGGNEQSEQEANSDFISLEQGVLSKYRGSDLDVEIPDDLSLPVTTLIYSYDEDICVSGMEELGVSSALSMCNQHIKPIFLENETAVSRTYAELKEMQDNEELAVDLDDMIPLVTKEVRIPSAESYVITTIPRYAFKRGITSITIGNRITTINDYAFYDFVLTNVTIRGEIEEIGDYAFNTKYDISSLIINTNQSNVILGSHAFRDGTQIQFKDGTITYNEY